MLIFCRSAASLIDTFGEQQKAGSVHHSLAQEHHTSKLSDRQPRLLAAIQRISYAKTKLLQPPHSISASIYLMLRIILPKTGESHA
jgi:hypothetical protein